MAVETTTNNTSAAMAGDGLDFEFDPAISRQVRQEIIDTLSRGRKDIRKVVEHELRSREVVTEFKPTLAALGLRHDNLADAMTAFWIIMWTIIHDEPLPADHCAAAVREQVRERLKGVPTTRDAGKRQMMGEGMIYEARLAQASFEEAKEAGNEFQLRQMAASARQNMTKKGINLGHMRITEAGLQNV